MIQQHGKLLQIHHRLKTMAEEQGNSSAALTHDAVLNRVKTLLQQDPRRLGDQRYLQALADCEEATKSNPQCPFFQLRASEARTN